MNNFYNKLLKGLVPSIFVICFFVSNSLNAQVTINTSGTLGPQTCHEDCEGTTTDGDRGDYYSDLDFFNAGTAYCARTVQAEGNRWDSDGIGAGPPYDCDTYRSAYYTVGPTCTNSGLQTYSWPGSPSGQCWGNFTYQISSSGTWPGNTACANVNGITNNSCGTAYDINPDNVSGGNQLGNDHTMDCADPAWYKYTLTTANVQRLEFSGNKNTGDFTAWTDVNEVYFNGCGCSLSDAGGSGDFAISNPPVGDYYFRVREQGLPSNITLFDVTVERKGTILPNDKISCATVLGSGGTLDICEQITGSGNNIGATDEDFCGVNEPQEDNDRTVWYKFTTGGTIGTNLKIVVSNAGGDNMTPDIALFKQVVAPGACGTSYAFGANLQYLADNSGVYLVDDDAEINISSCSGVYAPLTTYYLQIDDEGGTAGVGYYEGNFNFSITDNGKKDGANDICSAVDLTAAPPATVGTCSYGSNGNADATLGLGETLSRNNQSNYCATTQAGEPELGSVVCVDQVASTVWYKFTTAATAAPITVRVTDNGDAGGTDDIDPYISVYKSCGACTFGSNLVQVDEAGGTDVLGGAEADDYSFTFNPSPATTYYIQVAGWVDGALCGNSEKGDFNVSVVMGSTVIPGDYICNAILAGSTGWSESSTNDDKLGLGETIASTVNFTNKGTSVEDGCGIDEPDNNSGDETVWFKFQTGSNPGTEIAVNVDAISGSGTGGACVAGGTAFAWLKVWEWAGANPGGPLCTDATRFNSSNLIDIGDPDLLDQSKEYINCPKPNTWYFAQCELGFGSLCDMADFSATVVDNGIPQAPNDRICNATVMSTPTYTNPQNLVGTYTPQLAINQSNFCATNTGEPTPACFGDNNHSVWYKLPAAAAPGASDISNPGRKVVIINARSNHAGGSEDEINLQLALYSNSNMASCPTNPTTGFTLTSDIQGANCAYVGPASLDLDQLFQYSEYLTAACLTPSTDYYLMVDGQSLPLNIDFDALKKGWFEFDAYYPREIGDLPCSAVPFKTWGIPGTPAANSQDILYNNSNLCTSYTPGVGANQEPPTTFTTGDGNDNPGWVYFYAPASGSVKITATADPNDIMKDGVFDNIDLQLAIFEETVAGVCSTVRAPQSPVSSIVSYNILDGYGEEMYVNCLTPGKKYYIEVDGSASPITQTRGIFDLKIEDYAPNSYAPNDEMQDAIPFTNTYNATSTWNRINNKVTEQILDSKNWCADNLNEPGRPALGGFNETGVWYKFIAPPSGMVHFLAENTTYGSLTKPSGDPNHIDLSLAVYQLNAGFTASQYSNPAATTLIAQDYQNPLVTSGIAALGTSVEDEEMVVECLTPGREYYLLVSGKKSSGIGSDWDYGRYNLYITAHPRNPAKWNGQTVTIGGNQYLPTPMPASIDSVCNAADLGTMPAGTAWYQPFGDRQVPINCTSNFYQSPTFNNFCATATSDPTPGYQQDLINVFGGNHKPVWFKFTTPTVGAYDPSRISVEVEVISGDCDAGIFDDWYDSGCSPSDEEYQDCINAGVSVWLPSAVPTLCNTSLYEMDSDFDFDIVPSGEQADIHCMDPNTEYYIMIDGGSTNQEGNFSVRVRQITPDPRPFNNYICNAKKLTTGSNTAVASFWGGGAAFTYAKDTNICADTRLTSVSASGTEPIPSGWDVVSPPSDAADMTNTVWYSFLTPAAVADYAVHIDVNSELPWPFGDLVNPKIAVWESQDGSCNYTHPNGTNMVEMASEYDPLAFWGESIDVYCLKPNTRYFVQVGGTTNVYGQDQGYFDIVINDIPPIAIPVNDDVCSAINMGTISTAINSKLGNASSGASNYHNYCTDLEAGEPVPAAFTPDNTVWFKFRTPNNAGKRFNVTVNANSDPAPDHNDGINLQLALYESSVLGSCDFANFTEVESDFDALLWDETLNATCLKPNTDYYIQVDGTKGFLELFRAQGFGYFGIEVVTTSYYDAPSNDNMCNATNLGTVPVGGQLAPATWYYNTCATLEPGEIDPVGDVIDYGIDKTVWFKFVPGRDADFKISAISDCLLGAGCDPVDLQVALFRPTTGLAPACPAYTDMVQEAADYDVGFYDEDLTASCLKQGQTYYIQVDGSSLNIDGEFQIKIEDMGSSTAAPLNDNFCSATLMTFTGGVASLTNQSNVCATIQSLEPNAPADVQKSVWYKFQAPPSGRVRITTHDADGAFRGLDPEFYVYENGATFDCSAFSKLTANGSSYNPIPDVPIICPNCGDEEVEDECFVPGWWYLIQVDGTTVGGPQGKFDIKIEDLLIPYTVASGNKPANDDFATATTLTVQLEACSEGGGRTELVGSGTWTAQNYGKSTRDMINGLGYSGCDVSELCGDLWYKFVVTSPTCSNGYSPMIIQGKAKSTLTNPSKLHVIAYKGSAGALTGLGCGTASASLSGNAYFNFEINEAVGTTVYLQVFGEDAVDWDENFDICVSEKRGFDYCAHAAASPPMTYGVDYCYNIKGATLEPAGVGYNEGCPLTGIPGLPDPDSDAPTENSVYFKFVTDNTCSDYEMNFKYYFSDYVAFGTKGISYSIYKDDTPCDGAPIGSGSLDCQSFYNTNAGSFEYTILFRNNSYLTTATGVDNNSTYYIQIDGPGNNFGNLDGTVKITQKPICLPITIDSIPTQTLTDYYTCGDGWRHYYNLVGGVRKYKWSLYDNGNTALQGNVVLTYNNGANYYSATNGCIEASWVMRRYWNYNVTAGSIAAGSPVKIRFYYIPQEKQAIIDQMNTFALTGCTGAVEGFEWFKSHDGVAFNPALHIDPEYVIARYGSGISTNAAQSLTVLDDQTSCTVPAYGVNPAIPGVRYVEYQNLYSFSGGTGATGNGDDDSPLPIELTSFTGYHNADKYVNNLNWVTSSEINSSRFVVEKSLDGASFTYLGEKAGAGNSNTTLNYELVDTKPSLGDNYYRLKMIDKDGTFEYSKIININVGVGTAGSQILGIYPNPTRGMLNIRFLSGEKEKFTMRVINTTGQVVRENTFDFPAGINFIELNTFDFADGLYVLQFTGENGGRFDGKFVKE